MRYHHFETSPTRNLIITDSHGRNLTFPNFNILVLQNAQVRLFLLVKSRNDQLVLFIGGKDIPTGNTQILARNLSDLAVAASEAALESSISRFYPC